MLENETFPNDDPTIYIGSIVDTQEKEQKTTDQKPFELMEPIGFMDTPNQSLIVINEKFKKMADEAIAERAQDKQA